MTFDTAVDNLRPFVPRGHGRRICIIWFQGQHKTYTDYKAKIVGVIEKQKREFVGRDNTHRSHKGIGNASLDHTYSGRPKTNLIYRAELKFKTVLEIR